MNVKIIIFFLFPMFALAQTPQKINFQSIMRNSSGEVVGNRVVNMRISILSGSSSGNNVFSETHVKTTDAIGLVSLQVGTGTVASGVFSSIDWGNTAHFIKLEADLTGGNTYELLGTQELMSVPYALYAGKSDTSVLNLTSRLATKLNVTDTTYLSNRIDAKLSKTDTSVLNLTSRLATKLNVTDTTFLSNRMDAKLSKTDTSVLNLTSRLATKLNVTDTTYLSNRIDAKLSKIDTASLSNRIDAKAPINNPIFTGMVGGIDKIMVGLPNVDNTSDADKPISTATQTALITKVNTIDTADMLLPYLRDADTTTMLSTYLRKTDAIITNLQNQVELLSSYTSLLASGLVDIDGNNYPVVKIGNQIWLKENLRVSRYRNGDLIPIVTDSAAWSALTTGGRSWYSNDSTTYENPYGNLYNWYAVADSRGLCPTGWHVPSDAEWTTLTTYLEGESVAGSKMKSVGTTYWNPNTDATNESGFSAFPGGNRSGFNGTFFFIRQSGQFWSATETVYYNSPLYAWIRSLSNYGGVVQRGDYGYKSVGSSVRCLRD